jgi:hypothetical protein
MNGKMYLARFTNKESGSVDFFKFGHTSSYDAMDRFTYSPFQYSKWDIKIMKTVYGPLEQMKGIEETFKAFYPKNIWVEEKISGVTEVVQLTQQQVDRIIDRMSWINTVYYKQRERDKQYQQPEETND